jgi:hypothetical protein
MPGVHKEISSEDDICEVIKGLVRARRYHIIRIALPGSKEHARSSLPSDRYLITAFRVKDMARKKRVEEAKPGG